MTYDEKNFYHNSKSHSLLLKKNSKYNYRLILPLLNNKLFWFYLQHNGNILRGGYVGVKRKVLEPFGIPGHKDLNHNELETFTDNRIDQEATFQSLIHKFQNYILKTNLIYSLNNKLQSWHELEFGDFIKELNKAIKASNKVRAKEAAAVVSGSDAVPSSAVEIPQLTKKDEFEWMELFEENKKKAVELQREIENTDAEIDLMVYELYGLTEEEIAIVESS